MSPITTNCNVRDDLKDKTLEEIQEVQRQTSLNYAVAMLNLNGDLNLGVAMRSASIFGARHFFIFGKRAYDRRSCVGSQNYIEVVRVPMNFDNPNCKLDFFRTIYDYGYTPVFVENTISNPPTINNIKPCFIFGNEGYGIPEYLLENQYCIEIPQRGVMRCLNVSAAASIVCYEYNRICEGV